MRTDARGLLERNVPSMTSLSDSTLPRLAGGYGWARRLQSGKAEELLPLRFAPYDFLVGADSSCLLAGFAAGSPPSGMVFVLPADVSLLGAVRDSEKVLKDMGETPFGLSGQ